MAGAESIRESTSAIAVGQRFVALDAHRGFIMVLMAIDHASYFIARVHSAEFWGTALPVYPNVLWFWIRWITHLCAPGFFFLMGIGMILFADARRQAGWEEGQITRFFVIRGLLLICLQLFVEDPAWILGDLSAGPGAMVIRGAVPGGGTEGMIYLGVLFALGGAMVFWAFMRRVSFLFIGLISLVAVLVTQLAIPGPDHATTLYPPVLRLLMIPGHTNLWEIFYPVVPWLGVTGLGLLFGKLLKRDTRRAGRVAGGTGFGFLILFVMIRTAGGFGNLSEVPPGWMGFLNVVKYPPSLAFLTVTLGINLLLMGMWRWTKPHLLQSRYHPLLVFGRVALFFYLLHLWVFSLLGLFFRAGSGFVTMYGCWMLGLVILYPFCYWYNCFKCHKPLTSLWRFF